MDCPVKRGNESGNDVPALSTRLTKNAIDEEARSALPRGSVIQQNMTKPASIATRSIAALTVNRVTDERSLLHWQTSAATRTAATPTPNSVTDGRSLQQWRSIRGEFWLDGFSTASSAPLSRLVTQVGSRRPVPRPPFWSNYGTAFDPHARPQQKLLCGNAAGAQLAPNWRHASRP